MSRVVLVTGAASGIGAGLAAHFIKLGDQVVALDMNQAGLGALAERLHNPNLLPAVADVTDVNLRAVIRLSAAVLPAMLERRRGVIVNIASVAGLVAFPSRAAYSITKAAVIQVTRAIAADYGHKGIRSVALCPGMIDTPMTHWRLAEPWLREEVLARIPKRGVAAAAFFASDEASYCNGAAIPIDGGY